jgi:hypothetical protein
MLEFLRWTVFILILAGACLFIHACRVRQIHLWMGAYIRRSLRRKPRVGSGPIHLFVAVTDHFEPAWQRPPYEQECARVDTWVRRYPVLAAKHRDADGRCPQHTFFYPAEEYRPEHLHKLAQLCKSGFGDVEIHLHHDHDTAEGLREKLLRFKATLHERHGLLHRNAQTGEIEYGFIHGNWALDNASKDGRWCGVNDELMVLRETGCYADFTLPSAPSDTQTRTINSIYYAVDDPLRPKSHDTGVEVQVGKAPSGDLMIIQGPLALNWASRKWGVLPRIENGELSSDNPPTPQRVDCWIRQHIHVKGRPQWIFVKLHMHGAQEHNFDVALGQPMDAMLSYLETAYNDGQKYRLHYVTAREMYELIRMAERDVGESLDNLSGSDAPPLTSPLTALQTEALHADAATQSYIQSETA